MRLICLSFAAIFVFSSTLPARDVDPDAVTVAAYYFPNYHPGDERNTKNKGADWSEWNLVKNATPRFEGEHQPNVPAWGYEDESDPKVMEKKIAAAADYKVNAWIFDWYYYEVGPFLNKPLDEAFLHAPNRDRISFSVMWANHDWHDMHPYHKGAPLKLLYPGKVSPECFDRICDLLIDKYFKQPNYITIKGAPYFSIYDVSKFFENFGSVVATRAAMDRFRQKAVAAGLPGLHLNVIAWGRPILPGEKVPADFPELIRDLGFDSASSYVWVHHVGLPKMQTPYEQVRRGYITHWDRVENSYGVPYFPNVSMGWDPSPRANQDDPFGNFGYTFSNTISGNTPAQFKEALRLARDKLMAGKTTPRILTINAWNEWTEGSYIEPDTVNGMGYLEAIKDVFSKHGPAAEKLK